MLVLARELHETIVIGDDVEVTIVDIRGDKVRLGITAPRSIPVHRKEVYEELRRKNAKAGSVQAGLGDLASHPSPVGSGGSGIEPKGS